MILGIDLGTTNSLVCCYKEGRSHLIPNGSGEYLTPSVVSVDESNTILIGESARNRLITHPHHSVCEFKRFMGTQKQFRLGIHTFDATELSSFVLKSLKNDAEKWLNEDIKDVIISVPAYFNNLQREATKLAAKLSGFQNIRLLNEPTAAALSYGLEGSKSGEGRYIILDLGGGTFDVSLLEVFNGIFEIHASAGDNYLGGKDFTEVIVKDILEKHPCEAENISDKNNNIIYQCAEKIKRGLTEELTVSQVINVENEEWEYTLSQTRFSQLAEDLIQRVKRPIVRVLSDSGLNVGEIDGVILVGGATRMLMFRNLVSQLFKRIPRSDYHPDQAIVMGSGIYAGMLNENEDLQDVIMTDVCPYTLGVAISNRSKQLEFMPLIERNTTIPVSETRPLVPSTETQKTVVIKVYQGESFNPDNNLYLGRLEVDLPMPPVRRDFLLTYTYDLDGTLEVEVTFPETQTKYKTHIKDGQEVNGALLEERFQKLSHLKVLPVDQQRNRELLTRLELLFEESRGELRAYYGDLLRYFVQALDSFNTQKIESAYQDIKQSMEHYLN